MGSGFKFFLKRFIYIRERGGRKERERRPAEGGGKGAGKRISNGLPTEHRARNTEHRAQSPTRDSISQP